MGNPVSAWGRIEANTIALVEAITPSVDATTRWHHLGKTSDPASVGSTDREFSTLETPGGDVPLAGAGQRQERRVLVITSLYTPSGDVEDRIGGDHVDLINALQPTSTYPSDTWGSLRVRRVLEPERADPDEQGRIAVRRGVAVTYRFPVSI